jgi:hypothetical protein
LTEKELGCILDDFFHKSYPVTLVMKCTSDDEINVFSGFVSVTLLMRREQKKSERPFFRKSNDAE